MIRGGVLSGTPYPKQTSVHRLRCQQHYRWQCELVRTLGTPRVAVYSKHLRKQRNTAAESARERERVEHKAVRQRVEKAGGRVSVLVARAVRVHPVPSRTRSLSSRALRVLRWKRRGSVSRCQPPFLFSLFFFPLPPFLVSPLALLSPSPSCRFFLSPPLTIFLKLDSQLNLPA